MRKAAMCHPERAVSSKGLCYSCYERLKRDADPVYKARLYAAQRACKLKQKYGISVGDWNRMLAEQGGACALCRWVPTGHATLKVDHDHLTGRVRGLLCNQCNRHIMARVDSDPAIINRIAAYSAQSLADAWMAEQAAQDAAREAA